MTNYDNGKIYQIISPNHPVPYIGSTTQPLSKRMAYHRTPSNRASSRIIIEAGDAYIELIEEYPCENREQLNRREGEIIRSRECVNRCIAGRTKREWCEANREVLKERQKAYRDTNREVVKKRERIYYEANREARNEYNKAYHEANREIISERKKAYYSKKKANASSECPVSSPSSGSDVLS